MNTKLVPGELLCAASEANTIAKPFGLVLFPRQLSQPRSVKIPRALLERLTDTLVYAA